MKLLIGATAVMVSFGFENVHLRHFSKILIYPDDYFSTINKQYHQGEVNPRLGIIVLSWQNFLNGFTGKHDGVNLGIHEMAHALNLENRIHYNRESNFFNPQKWKRFIVEAKKELENMKNGESDFFRASAAINSHEFFAVTLEAFFEKPIEFRSYNGGLYKSLVFLLQQDPIVLTGKEV
jgi:MtfA peptidase